MRAGHRPRATQREGLAVDAGADGAKVSARKHFGAVVAARARKVDGRCRHGAGVRAAGEGVVAGGAGAAGECQSAHRDRL